MAKFYLGQLVATRGVAEAMRENPDFDAFVSASLRRYLDCDWGEMEQWVTMWSPCRRRWRHSAMTSVPTARTEISVP